MKTIFTAVVRVNDEGAFPPKEPNQREKRFQVLPQGNFPAHGNVDAAHAFPRGNFPQRFFAGSDADDLEALIQKTQLPAQQAVERTRDRRQPNQFRPASAARRSALFGKIHKGEA